MTGQLMKHIQRTTPSAIQHIRIIIAVRTVIIQVIRTAAIAASGVRVAQAAIEVQGSDVLLRTTDQGITIIRNR